MEGKAKKRFEEVLDTFRIVAEKLCADVPELRSVVIVTDWEVGQRDFPFGAIFGAGSKTIDIAACLGRLTQTQKMLAFQTEQFTSVIAAMDEAAKNLSSQIDEASKQLAPKEASG